MATIFYCEDCRCPVVDSQMGKLRHANVCRAFQLKQPQVGFTEALQTASEIHLEINRQSARITYKHW